MHKYVANYHQFLFEHWAERAGCAIPGYERMPYLGQLPDANRSSEILFLGMNPSYRPDVLEKHWSVVHAQNERWRDLGLQALQWSARGKQELLELQKALIELDLHSRKVYRPYYAPIERVACAAGVSGEWQHLDLFPLRQTAQAELTAHLPLSKRDNNVTPWPTGVGLRALFDATLGLIAAMHPKVVVVVNSRASRLLEKYLPLRLQDNAHRYEGELLPGAAFLLTSQLSGGATSTYTEQRLAADLRDAFKGGQGFAK